MKTKILIPFLIALLALMPVESLTTNGSGMDFDFGMVDGQRSDALSTNFKTSYAIGTFQSVSSSSTYKTEVGVIRTMPYINSESCQVNSECAGNYCCSNACQSSACPSSVSSSSQVSRIVPNEGGSSLLVNETQEQKINDFSVNPNSLKERLFLGEEKTISISIKNTGSANLTFEASAPAINEFIKIEDAAFNLESGEEKIINFKIIGKKLGSYIGELQFSASGVRKSLTIGIDVVSQQLLFDVEVHVLPERREVEPGSDLAAQIILFKIGPEDKTNIAPIYAIQDKQGKVVYESSESLSVEKQLSYIKSIRIPDNLQPGEYVLVVKLSYNDSFAASSDFFKVVPKKYRILQIIKSNLALMTASVLAAASVLFSIFLPKLKEKFTKKQRRKNDKQEPNAETKL